MTRFWPERLSTVRVKILFTVPLDEVVFFKSFDNVLKTLSSV